MTRVANSPPNARRYYLRARPASTMLLHGSEAGSLSMMAYCCEHIFKIAIRFFCYTLTSGICILMRNSALGSVGISIASRHPPAANSSFDERAAGGLFSLHLPFHRRPAAAGLWRTGRAPLLRWRRGYIAREISSCSPSSRGGRGWGMEEGWRKNLDSYFLWRILRP